MRGRDQRGYPSRRTFLSAAGWAVAVGAMHQTLAATDEKRPAKARKPSRPPKPPHRIQSMTLQTAVSIETMAAFYRDTLEMKVVSRSKKACTVEGGRTRITFEKVDTGEDDAAPFYHVAFNIAENKITGAHDWLKARTTLYATPRHMLDDRYPAGVRHFRSWDAHAVFFADPAGNVLEYIARHELDTAARGAFTPDDVLYASELALVADDVDDFASRIKHTFDLEQYGSGSDRFRAIGDARGLLLVFKRDRAMGVSPDTEIRCAVFDTRAQIASTEARTLSVDAYPYEIEAKVVAAPQAAAGTT